MQELRRGNLLSVAGDGEGCQAQVNAHGFAVGRELGTIHLHHEAGEVTTGTVLDDGRTARGGRQVAAPIDGDTPHLREAELSSLNPKSIGLKPDALPVVALLEARSTGLTLVLPPVTEGLIQVPERLLEWNVGNLCQPTSFRGLLGLSNALFLQCCAPWVLLSSFVEVLAQRQGIVPNDTGAAKDSRQCRLLVRMGVEAVAVAKLLCHKDYIQNQETPP